MQTGLNVIVFLLSNIVVCVFLLQTVRHGFPYQPTALAFDPVQKILAIGSRSGGVRMYPLPLICVDYLFFHLGSLRVITRYITISS